MIWNWTWMIGNKSVLYFKGQKNKLWYISNAVRLWYKCKLNQTKRLFDTVDIQKFKSLSTIKYVWFMWSSWELLMKQFEIYINQNHLVTMAGDAKWHVFMLFLDVHHYSLHMRSSWGLKWKWYIIHFGINKKWYKFTQEHLVSNGSIVFSGVFC